MILTCPSCDTRFHVEPTAFGIVPRKVRCSRCRAVWNQEPLPEPEPQPVPSVVQAAGMAAAVRDAPEDDWVPPPPPGGRPPEPESLRPPPVMDLGMDAPPPPRITGFDDEPEIDLRHMDRPPPLHPPLDEPFSPSMPEEDPDEALNRRRARLAEAGVQREPPKPKKKRSWAWIGWLLLLVVTGGIVGGGYEKRVELVAFYPPLAKLYEFLHVPVDAAQWLGLELHNLKSATVLDNGQTRIAVSGDVVNVSTIERALPPIRIAMRGAGGADLGAVMIKLEESSVPAGETLSFDVRLPAPAGEVVDLEVAFSSQPVP